MFEKVLEYQLRRIVAFFFRVIRQVSLDLCLGIRVLVFTW